MKSMILSFFMLFLSYFSFAQQTISSSITHNGIQRDYIIYIPAIYSTLGDVPLVFNFHGYTSNAASQMFYGDFRSIADTAGFIIVHPQGTLDNNSTTHWNIPGWNISNSDDVGFTNNLLDTLIATYNIDTSKVYSTGMSNGGFFSFLLACEMSDRIAAVASVTGGMTSTMINNCNATHPTPVMQIHGTSDNVVAYNGSVITEPIDNVVNFWVNYNNCLSTPTITDLADVNTSDGSTVKWFQYLGGDNGSEVEHYKIAGGAHTWPGSAISNPGTNYDFDASAKIWEFFLRYDINGQVSTVSNSSIINDVSSLKFFPNPTSDLINIKIDNFIRPLDYQLSNVTGQIIETGVFYSDTEQLYLNTLEAGLYFITIEGKTYKVVKI